MKSTKTNKILCTLFSVIMTLSLVPAPVYAQPQDDAQTTPSQTQNVEAAKNADDSIEQPSWQINSNSSNSNANSQDNQAQSDGNSDNEPSSISEAVLAVNQEAAANSSTKSSNSQNSNSNNTSQTNNEDKEATLAELASVYVSANSTGTDLDGSREKPFATLADAYNAVSSGGTIYLLTDIEQNTTLTIDADKDFTLTSDGGTHTISGTTSNTYLTITSGTVTLQNITVAGHGKDGTAHTKPLINVGQNSSGSARLILQSGATIKDFNANENLKEWGTICIYSSGTLSMYDGAVIKDCTAGSGVVRVWGGTFNMYGGLMENCDSLYYNNEGTTVYIANSGTMNMSGGTIKNCGEKSGEVSACTVFLHPNGSNSFSMTGGEITGNRAKYGAVYSGNNNNTIELSGDPKIYDNTGLNLGDDVESNIYLQDNQTITIGADGLNSGADVGVYTTTDTSTSDVPFANGASESDADYIHSDKPTEQGIVYNSETGTLDFSASAADKNIAITLPDSLQTSGGSGNLTQVVNNKVSFKNIVVEPKANTTCITGVSNLNTALADSGLSATLSNGKITISATTVSKAVTVSADRFEVGTGYTMYGTDCVLGQTGASNMMNAAYSSATDKLSWDCSTTGNLFYLTGADYSTIDTYAGFSKFSCAVYVSNATSGSDVVNSNTLSTHIKDVSVGDSTDKDYASTTTTDPYINIKKLLDDNSSVIPNTGGNVWVCVSACNASGLINNGGVDFWINAGDVKDYVAEKTVDFGQAPTGITATGDLKQTVLGSISDISLLAAQDYADLSQTQVEAINASLVDTGLSATLNANKSITISGAPTKDVNASLTDILKDAAAPAVAQAKVTDSSDSSGTVSKYATVAQALAAATSDGSVIESIGTSLTPVESGTLVKGVALKTNKASVKAVDDAATIDMNEEGSITLTKGKLEVTGETAVEVVIKDSAGETKTVEVSVPADKTYVIDADAGVASSIKTDESIVIDSVEFVSATDDGSFPLDIDNANLPNVGDKAIVPAATCASISMGDNATPVVAVLQTNTGSTTVINGEPTEIVVEKSGDKFTVGDQTYTTASDDTEFSIDEDGNVTITKGSAVLHEGESIIAGGSGKTVINPDGSGVEIIVTANSPDEELDTVIVPPNGKVIIDDDEYIATEEGATLVLGRDGVTLVKGSIVIDEAEISTDTSSSTPSTSSARTTSSSYTKTADSHIALIGVVLIMSLGGIAALGLAAKKKVSSK